jgi:hypothetical protein
MQIQHTSRQSAKEAHSLSPRRSTPAVLIVASAFSCRSLATSISLISNNDYPALLEARMIEEKRKVDDPSFARTAYEA